MLYLTAGTKDGWPTLERVHVWVTKPNYKEGDAAPWYATPSGPAMEIARSECDSRFGLSPTTENMCIVVAMEVGHHGFLLPPGGSVAEGTISIVEDRPPSPFMNTDLGEPWTE